MIVRVVIAFVASYLLGAIPTSKLVARWARGIDLRQVGSGNLGATNLYRVLGLRFAAPVAVFDALKGAVPVALFGPWAGLGAFGSVLLGVAAVIGHVFPVFAEFRGGKGVATTAGIVLGVAPGAFVFSLAMWGVLLAITRYVSLASVVAAMLLPAAVWVLEPARRNLEIWFVLLTAAIIWLHRANLHRLLLGTEHRIGSPGPTREPQR